jgi:hypothetical protein
LKSVEKQNTIPFTIPMPITALSRTGCASRIRRINSSGRKTIAAQTIALYKRTLAPGHCMILKSEPAKTVVAEKAPLMIIIFFMA